jgi:hypothetical protein
MLLELTTISYGMECCEAGRGHGGKVRRGRLVAENAYIYRWATSPEDGYK